MPGMYVCVRVCMYICTSMRMYDYFPEEANTINLILNAGYVCVCVYVCIYVHVCVCMIISHTRQTQSISF